MQDTYAAQISATLQMILQELVQIKFALQSIAQTRDTKTSKGPGTLNYPE